MIDSFRGKYFFLSNFYKAPVIYDGLQYHSNETAFQAQKTLDERRRLFFIKVDPSRAKRLGRSLSLREDWEDIKDKIMYDICMAKFTQNLDLKQKLLDTKNEELVEGNDWGDCYWGKCNGKGENKLGKILMTIRKELS